MPPRFFITVLSLAFIVTLCLPAFAVAQEAKASEGLVPCGRDVFTAQGAREFNASHEDDIEKKRVKQAVAGALKNPCGFDDAIELARRLINGWILVGVIIATFGFAYAGYLYITAMGSEEKIKHAHSIFYKIILGFMFMLGAWLIAVVLEDTFLCRKDKQGNLPPGCEKEQPSFLQRRTGS